MRIAAWCRPLMRLEIPMSEIPQRWTGQTTKKGDTWGLSGMRAGVRIPNINIFNEEAINGDLQACTQESRPPT